LLFSTKSRATAAIAHGAHFLTESAENIVSGFDPEFVGAAGVSTFLTGAVCGVVFGAFG
jgi:hypothetical protein